jgi:hypothetical protein
MSRQNAMLDTPASVQPRLGVAALNRLHLVLDGRAPCGQAVEDADVYEDKAGLPAWNDGPPERCARCAEGLAARLRWAPRHVTAPPAIGSEIR